MSPNSRSLASKLLHVWELQSSSVSPLRSIRHKSVWVYGENRYTCVFLLYGSHRCLWLLVNALCWGLNHTSAKCGFYQIIRVLNHCLPTIVLTEECERGNKLLHRVGACVCATDSVVISDVTEQQTTTCFIASQPLSMSICNITNANITLNWLIIKQLRSWINNFCTFFICKLQQINKDRELQSQICKGKKKSYPFHPSIKLERKKLNIKNALCESFPLFN